MKTLTRHIMLLCLLMLCAANATAASVGKHTFAPASALAHGTWVKVKLDGTEDGIYQITYDQLAQMGFSHPKQVGVFGFGGHALPEDLNLVTEDDLPEVAAYHDDANRRILFYGRGLVRWDYDKTMGFHHRQNTSEVAVYYFLHQKEETARLMTEVADHTLGEQVATTVQTYDAYELHEDEQINIGHTGREKYGESLLSITSQRFGLKGGFVGDVRLTVNFAAKGANASTLDIALDGGEKQSVTLNKTTSDYAFANEATFDRWLPSEEAAEHTVALTYHHPTGGNASVARLNYIRLQGQRAFSRPDNYLLFRHHDAASQWLRYDIRAAWDESVQVWDVTSAYDVRRQLVDDGIFSPDVLGLREYALVNVAGKGFPGVSKVATLSNQNLHGLPLTDMVIITAPAYLAQAQRLAKYRQQHDGLHVTVLTPEPIYNEFSSGGQDVTAFRLLMKMFYDRYHLAKKENLTGEELHEPRYLLLMGDGYYDNLEIDRQYHLPVYETEASLAETSSCVCDDYFGFLDDGEGGRMDNNLRYQISADKLDIGIGRLPVTSVQQATNAVTKIINYSNNRYFGTWKNRLCFLSDDDKQGDSFNCHVRHNDQLVKSLEEAGHKEFVVQKIYLPAYTQTSSAAGTDYPDAKKEFNESLKQGVLLVNYAGHGSTTAITNENMMTATMASQLNMPYLPLWVTASCDVARWDDDEDSMGEMLCLNPNGGAIAMLTTVRVVYAQQNLLLNQAIIDNLFNRFSDGTRYRLGDVIKAAKLELGSDYNKLNFCLLGDPSLTLAYPEHQMRITEVNGIAITPEMLADTETRFPLNALHKVTMRGCVLQNGSNEEVDTSFNGLAYPTLYDALETLTADKGYVQDDAPTYTFSTRSKRAFAGRCEVRAGEFEFSFTVPQDISYSDLPGLANLYACSDEGAEAQGFFDHYMLTSGEMTERTDNEGPVVRRLFLNSSSFSDGATVNSTPYLYAEIEDESGFNATGNTIGHDMLLTIRCISNPVLKTVQHTLNDYFTTFTGQSNVGNIQFSIPALTDGTYEATLRVWDVYNNSTTCKFNFTVSSEETPQVAVVQAYPSPARSGDVITFRVLHNRPESAQEIRLQVFTQTGYKVLERNVSATTSQKVYALDMEHPTELNPAINADETASFLGSASMEWDTQGLPAGFYVYRIVMSSGGSNSISRSKVLMVNPK